MFASKITRATAIATSVASLTLNTHMLELSHQILHCVLKHLYILLYLNESLIADWGRLTSISTLPMTTASAAPLRRWLLAIWLSCRRRLDHGLKLLLLVNQLLLEELEKGNHFILRDILHEFSKLWDNVTWLKFPSNRSAGVAEDFLRHKLTQR